MTLLSTFYIVQEIAINPEKINAAYLISKTLELPLKNTPQLLEILRGWQEIKHVDWVKKDEIEGDLLDLLTVFKKAGPVTHKFQIEDMERVSAYQPKYLNGIEIAKYYLKKFECASLFLVNDKGDFIAMQYATGINPALYQNELAIMSKIVYATRNV